MMMNVTLERLFPSPGQVSVLRALWKAPAPLTGRQVQQLAGVHNLTAMRCLEDLERLGILQRRSAGRAYLYALKPRNRIVRDLVGPVFRAEQQAPEQFIKAIGNAMKGHCLSAVLYGSVARGQAGPESDVDLLVVVRDGTRAERFAATIQPKAERMVREGWSLILEVNVKTRRDLARQWNGNLMRQIRREGRVVAGKDLEEVRRG